jgi:TPR repeat protein
MHYAGEGVQEDFAEARRLLGLAAAQGDAEAQYGLGSMHYSGEGGAQDLADVTRGG